MCISTSDGNRTVSSREGPGKIPGWNGTGQDLETLKVPWSCGPRTKEVQKSRDLFLKVPGLLGPFFEGPGTPWSLFFDRILLIRFKTKVHH